MIGINDSLGSTKLIEEFKAQTYYCQICFEENDISVGCTLPCCHVFCRACLANYLVSTVTDGKVYPKCFHLDEESLAVSEETVESGLITQQPRRQQSLGKYRTCDYEIPPNIIEEVLGDNTNICEKYHRYKFSKENKNARECPYCSEIQIGLPEITSKIECSKCKGTFCYYHANAHDFNVYPTCAEYDASVAVEMQSSVILIESTSKQCPGCRIFVMKSGRFITIRIEFIM